MMLKQFTTPSKMFIVVKVQLRLTNTTPKIPKSFQADTLLVKRDLQCIRTVNFRTMARHVRNIAVILGSQRLLFVTAIIKNGTTERKTETVQNTLPFLIITIS